MDVYLLASGSYEDYHIISVFSDEELATKIANELGSDNFWVETYELDADAEYVRNGLYCYFVEMRDNGDVNQVKIQESYYRLTTMKWSNPFFIEIQDHHFNKERMGGVGARWMWIYLLARDEDHAIEIANEKRIELLSTGTWRNSDER